MSETKLLTNRQSKFVQEYMVDFNATRAAVRAGYSKKAARQVSSRLLTFANIQAEIRRLRGAQQQRFQVSRDEMLHRLMDCVRFDPSCEFELDDRGMLRIRRDSDLRFLKYARISISKTEHGESISICFPYHLDAIKLVCKMLGYDEDSSDDSGSKETVLGRVREIMGRRSAQT